MSNNKIISVFTASKNKKYIFIAAIVMIILIVVWFKKDRASDKSTAQLATFTVQKGPLTISVIESGTIKAREQIIIKNEVEGRSSIITLIPEGDHVKKGDLLVELDTSTLNDAKIDQEIRVQNAEAAFINTTEDLAVIKNQTQSDIDKAKLTLEFARQDLKQYKEGQYPNQLAEAKNEITLAKEELTRAQETLQWSEKLFKEKYISQTELQADQLTLSRATVKVEVTQNDLKLMETFTYGRQIAQLESNAYQAEMALERAMRKAKADIVQVEAALKAKEAEFERQKTKLGKLIAQLDKAKIYAPVDGLVIYATSARTGGPYRGGSQQPLEEGQEVFERQELIYLPTTDSTMAEVAIHESRLEKIHIGLPAVITIDALPGKKFLGHLATIAPLPDARSIWMNPDLKVYNSKIYLDESNPELRTGMSCKTEIIIEQYDSVISIPIQAVMRVKGEPTVYLIKDKQTIPRKVETGLDNNRMIRIISGLQEGDVVLLTPPLKSGTIEPLTADHNVSSNLDNTATMKQKINERIKKSNGTQQGNKNQAPMARPDKTQKKQRQQETPASQERDPMKQHEIGKAPLGISSQETERMKQKPQNAPIGEREKLLQQPPRNITPNTNGKEQGKSQDLGRK